MQSITHSLSESKGKALSSYKANTAYMYSVIVWYTDGSETERYESDERSHASRLTIPAVFAREPVQVEDRWKHSIANQLNHKANTSILLIIRVH